MSKFLIASFLFCYYGLTAAGQTRESAKVLARRQVPILCYHQIREWRPDDRQVDKEYIMPPALFRAHMKLLADSGYHTILPDELHSYLTKGTVLPAKAILLTFDDTDGDQFEVARPELLKYGFKGVYFIVTTDIGKNRHYMSGAQVKQLSAEGNVIACHTRDHVNCKKLQGKNWVIQVNEPARQLEKITGKAVKYFAFPYGLWNTKALLELRKQGFLAAFQLDQPRDPVNPMMTIRRVIDSGYWDAVKLDFNIKHDFGRLFDY
ncbi:polysaccharide deacetylase family protein [Mucilaginibacter sp. UYCu711]|uniref:polysaccharide deacetylase family protein n=1 Tax=Mucilaginibacter sp. UYCu711 TaxID=3156339 RepID=UPI003D1B42A2